ncbi:unnamed protein product [Caenorhabditis bovis]|uniref:Uncharacterized protein n=1 Tax=Caenorhabditis bovis TaxID=2654633 RepID=A0A8S1F1U4_9PELO|nr:unnamed protein product [Caenorhabditis bovis]
MGDTPEKGNSGEGVEMQTTAAKSIFGRRVSSVEPVKNAMPPTKKASVVIFETPDSPKQDRKASSWWRNLMMDDDKTAPPHPEIVISPENAANGLDSNHRNISTTSVGDRE